MREAAALGFAGLYVKEDVGGSALSRLDASLVFEQLSYGDVATAAFISIHNMASWMVDNFASDELRRKYLPKMTTMEAIAADAGVALKTVYLAFETKSGLLRAVWRTLQSPEFPRCARR